MKIRRLPDSFVWANLFLIFALIATFILYLLYPTWEFQQKGNLLINGYLLALFLLTSCSGLLLFRKSEIKQTDTLTFRLIKIFSVLFGIAWFFLVVWFVARVPGKDLFSSTLYLFSKLVMIAVSLILYFYLFALYKRKLQREKLSRSRGFVTIDELSLPAGTITRLKGEKANETRGVTDTRYRKSLLKTKKLEAYKKIVEEFFLENSHVYLDADFNMNVLSSRTGIPRYHLSQVFSLAFQVSFSEYVNRKRIAHACELMKEGNPTLTISELTEKCGFRSRASFYHHFKKVVGCIPGEYVEPS